MKKVFLSLILVSLTCHIQAQLMINNHVVHYDSYTNSWLATIPETMFGKDCQLSITIQDGWNSLTIDNQLVGNQYTFKEISAKSTYQTSITDADGNTVSGALRFTFLPIIHLDGLFGYEYQQGTVTISIPNEKNDYQALMARIKWRGGTTNTNEKHKRNYSIKFDTDIKLFGMRKDNNWMLDAGQPDVFRMRNRIAMDLWNDMAYKPYYADKEPKALNGV
ncbi:MAG: CotH kinase family protein, partial [Prevotella sp.]|nr:CotH kinase family protein [Prevotella sp.]